MNDTIPCKQYGKGIKQQTNVDAIHLSAAI